jgi:hypothetical protein
MPNRFAQTAFTPAVAETQRIYGSRDANKRLERLGPPRDTLAPEEVEFIRACDSFYLASVSETGWPYVQHRGGPKGFLKIIDEKTVGFSDFRGNRELITVGNLSCDDHVELMIVDYPRRARLKILGHARVLDPEQTSLHHSNRSLRLELQTAHHAALHARTAVRAAWDVAVKNRASLDPIQAPSPATAWLKHWTISLHFTDKWCGIIAKRGRDIVAVRRDPFGG